MHTVVEVPRFIKRSAEAGMTEKEREELIGFLASNPFAGDEIAHTGGCRKIRWAGKGKGKRGGFRVIAFFSGETIPVFLLTVYARNEKADLSPDEARELGKLTKALVAGYKRMVWPPRHA
jgi:mRNA-degrading endonuclease RelE of RelBE toxin-antitoxin system